MQITFNSRNLSSTPAGELTDMAELCLDAICRPLEVTVGTYNDALMLFDFLADVLTYLARMQVRASVS